jgi:O-antigen ligase
VAAAILIMLSGAILGPVFARGATEETPLLRLAWLPAYAAIAWLVIWRFQRLAAYWFPAVAALALVALAFASQWWSLAPDVTGRRVIALGVTTVFALWLAAVYPGQRLAQLLTQTGLVMAAGALVFVFAWPEIGVHHDVNAGLWRGMWSEKNQMGWVMVAVATAAAAVLASAGRGKGLAAVTWLLSTALVLGTQSKTALLCLLAASGLIAALHIIRTAPPALAVAGVWLGVVLAGCVGAVALLAPDLIFEALGKDPSLTGRTLIWDALLRRVEERPLLGHGYSAFWGAHSAPAAWIRRETEWLVPSAHNGWLEILAELGWVGLCAVATVVALAVLGTVSRLPGAGGREGFWSIGYLVAFLILSFSESVLLRHQSLPWVLFLVAFVRAFAPSVVAATVGYAGPRRDDPSARRRSWATLAPESRRA